MESRISPFQGTHDRTRRAAAPVPESCCHSPRRLGVAQHRTINRGEQLSSESRDEGGGEGRWISTGRGRGSQRGAEGEEAAGCAGGERVEAAPRGRGARRSSEQRGVAGGVEDQRAARLVRHGRARFLSSPPFRPPRAPRFYSAGPRVGLTRLPQHASRDKAHVSVMRPGFSLGLVMGLENGLAWAHL